MAMEVESFHSLFPCKETSVLALVSQALTHCALKVETFIERVFVVRLTCAGEIKPCMCGWVKLSQSLKKAHHLPLFSLFLLHTDLPDVIAGRRAAARRQRRGQGVHA